MVFQLKWYWSTGVCPRGAQVRHRWGRWLNPLSSMKTMVRPSFSAFFNRRPCPALPFANGFFVALQCSPSGPLGTPAQLAEQLPDMAGMIMNAELPPNQIGDPGTGPQRRLITKLLRPFQ